MNSEQLLNKKMILFSLTWPIFMETLLRMLFGSVDIFMLGGYSDNAVAGVGAANQFVSFVIMLFQITAAGSGIVISQYLGAKNLKKASEVTVVSLVFNLVIGILVSLLMVLFSGKLLGIMNLEKDIMGYSKEFLTIMGSFAFIQAMSCTIVAVLRSHGLVKWPMIVNMCAIALNIAGNYIFLNGVFGLPVLGVKGVAMSTVISQSLGLIAIFIIFLKKIDLNLSIKQILSLPKSTILEVLKDIFKIGGPSAGENMSYNISQIVITSFISLMGANALTARFYSFNLMYYIMLFGLSIGQATQILIGHQIGAGKIEQAYKRCLKSLKISIVIAFILAIIFAIFSRSLLDLFTDKKEIIAIGSMLFFISIVLEPGRAFNIVLGNSLKAAGDARYIFVIGVASMWGVAVLLAYILGIKCGLGLLGVWIAFACDEWLRGILMLLRWRSRVWEKMSIVQKSDEEGWLEGSEQGI